MTAERRDFASMCWTVRQHDGTEGHVAALRNAARRVAVPFSAVCRGASRNDSARQAIHCAGAAMYLTTAYNLFIRVCDYIEGRRGRSAIWLCCRSVDRSFGRSAGRSFDRPILVDRILGPSVQSVDRSAAGISVGISAVRFTHLPVSRSTDWSFGRSLTWSVRQRVGRFVRCPTGQTVRGSVGRSVRRFIDLFFSQSTQSVGRSASGSVGWSVGGRVICRSACRWVDPSVSRLIGRSVSLSVDRSVWRSVSSSVVRPVGRSKDRTVRRKALVSLEYRNTGTLFCEPDKSRFNPTWKRCKSLAWFKAYLFSSGVVCCVTFKRHTR